MLSASFPERPWSRVGADFFQYQNSMYLLAVDYYSRDIEICIVSKTVNAAETILKFKKIFSRHGICETLVTDGAPMFSSRDFASFCESWKIEHIMSSPRYPQGNSEAERAVQTIKNLLRKCDDEYLALLTYRNTPLAIGYSPAELSMGRKLRTRVPCHPDDLLPKSVDRTAVKKAEADYRRRVTRDYNKRHRVVPGDEFKVGDRVWIPDCKSQGVVEKLDTDTQPRSLVIRTGRGTFRRNRRMVRRYQTENVPQEGVDITASEAAEFFKFPDQGGDSSSSATSVDRDDHHEAAIVRRSDRNSTAPRRYIEEY